MTIEVWYPLGVAGAGASFAASGLAAMRTRLNVASLAATAAGALAAIVALDLVPDIRADAPEAGVSRAALIGVAIATSGGLFLAALRAGRRPGDSQAGLLAPAFLIHGLLEGIAGGTVIGWHASVGIGLIVALTLHKAAEGADLAASLRGVEESREEPVKPSRRGWLIGGAAAPLVGCAAAVALPLPDQLATLIMTAVCCVLARACVRLLRRAANNASVTATGVAAAAGALAMAVLIILA